MERFLWGIVPVGLMAVGVSMILWPAKMIVLNRDDKEDTSAPSAGEVWWMRVVGVGALIAGVYILYRLLGGTWGAGQGNFDPGLI